MTKFGVDAIGMSTTLESNKSLPKLCTVIVGAFCYRNAAGAIEVYGIPVLPRRGMIP
jgi:hypothetical protein